MVELVESAVMAELVAAAVRVVMIGLVVAVFDFRDS